MKKAVKLSSLLLVMFASTACGQNPANSSSTSAFYNPSFHPVAESWKEEDVFAKPVTYELNNTITTEEAETIVNNDIIVNVPDKLPKQLTHIEATKKEFHATTNRSTGDYIVKDYYLERRTTQLVDSENKWSYSRISDESKTVYFEEEQLVRHEVLESLYFYRNNYLYFVCAELDYYEGKESDGVYNCYYAKTKDLSKEEIDNHFTINTEAWAYFHKYRGFANLDRRIKVIFDSSSSYYSVGKVDNLNFQTDHSFASKGSGYLDCLVNQTCTYRLNDLDDYPSEERNVLKTIDYQQKYLSNISNYFSYDESYITTSVSKDSDKKAIREDTNQGRRILSEGCEIFYPDLSNFKERNWEQVFNTK